MSPNSILQRFRPATTKTNADSKTASRRRIDRYEKERRLQRTAIASCALAILLVIGIPAFGYYREVVARGQEEIARVNSVGFKMDDYIKQLRYRQRQIDSQVDLLNQFGGANGAAQQVAQQRAVLPTQIVFDWVDEEIIRQLGPKLGINPTAEEVDAQLRKDLTPPASTDSGSSDPAATPTPVPAPFEERYRSLLNFTGLTDAEYRDIVRTRVMREKLETMLKEKVPTSAEQVRVRGLLAEREEDAKAALERLKKGDTWTDVASEVSNDPSRDQAGDMGWIARGIRDKEFEDAVFGLRRGSGPQGPFNTRAGYYVFELMDGPSTLPLSTESLESLRSGVVSKWLEEQKKDPSLQVEYKITSDRQLWAQDRLDKERRDLQRRAAQQSGQRIPVQ